MKLVIPSFPDGGPIPGEFAFCVPADEGHATFGPNRSPHLNGSKSAIYDYISDISAIQNNRE